VKFEILPAYGLSPFIKGYYPSGCDSA
jgi:hypothetical protein